MGKHGEHGNSSFSCLQIAWKSIGSMVQHSLIISDSMEKHGEHGKEWGAWKSMGSMEKHFLMISDSMGKHGKHGNSSFSWLYK